MSQFKIEQIARTEEDSTNQTFHKLYSYNDDLVPWPTDICLTNSNFGFFGK